MGPSNVFRQSSLDDIDNIALFKKVFYQNHHENVIR